MNSKIFLLINMVYTQMSKVQIRKKLNLHFSPKLHNNVNIQNEKLCTCIYKQINYKKYFY